MPLTKPQLDPVSPGEPLTAQGWNALVTGLSALYDAVVALGGATLEVAVTAAQTDLATATAIADATVIAQPLGEGRAVAALPPFGAGSRHLLVGLTDGPWRVHVQAPGFVPEVRDVTLPRSEPLAVPLGVAGVRVPDLFGRGARGALDALRAAGIDADVLLDTTGREVSRAALPPEYVDSPVLFQLPAAGTVVPAGTGRVRLVVASALRRDPVVTMPSLVGLSLSEAKQVLERVGLTFGETTLRG